MRFVKAFMNKFGALEEKETDIEIAIRAFDDSEVADPTDPHRRLFSNGRGIYLIRALMDEVRFEEHSNVVHMRKKLRRAFE
jgi:anti-sigma regulatory factor (Ser/Thr protein kinase)